MASVAFIDDAIAQCASLQKTSCVAGLDAVDDGATTDIGQSSASETESSSGLSSNEGRRNLSRRCRFGNTALETIPATPSAATMPLNSPPGLSRAAMREARDACKPEAPTDSVPENNALTPSGVTLSRFGETPFGTVPKTPSGKSKLKQLKSVLGSPPGLSHTEKRRARDAYKGVAAAPASWGSSDMLSTAVLSGKNSAQSRLAKAREEAALLKDLKSKQTAESDDQLLVHDAESEHTDEATMGDNSEAEPAAEESDAKRQNCRFDLTTLGTMPSTPLRKGAAPTSPPGLSRKAMRQNRDSIKAPTPAVTTWGPRKSETLTISPAGKPLEHPAEDAARQRAARDAMALGWGGVVKSMHQVSGPR